MTWVRIVPPPPDLPARHDSPPPRRGGAALQRRLEAQQTARTEAARTEAEQRHALVVQQAQARQARQMHASLLSRPAAERDTRQSVPTGVEHPRAEPESVLAAALSLDDDGGGGQGDSPESAIGAPDEAADGGLDGEMLLGCLSESEEGGIFELLLPDGDRLAVVADIGARQACFLLTPSSDRLRVLLNRQRMELEGGLARRMDRHVRLTVL